MVVEMQSKVSVGEGLAKKQSKRGVNKAIHQLFDQGLGLDADDEAYS